MLPTSMKGDGFYKAHSSIQRTVIDISLPLVEQAASRIPLPEEPESLRIVDYGCGNGKNSLIAIGASMEAVRKRKPDQDFSVVHNDLPSNDFNSLLQDIHGDSQDSYLRATAVNGHESGQVYVLISATSFLDKPQPRQRSASRIPAQLPSL